MEPDCVLELRHLSKRFGSHCAVSSLSLRIPRGTFFSLLGPSGCGKTTTLRLVAGFEAPDEGEIWLNGSRIDALPPFRRNVNTVFQNYALFPHLTVRGNVEFGLRRARAHALEIEKRVQAVLDQVRLGDKQSRRPAQLSGGERQRVALARSLVLEPGVLLLDEPLSALDPQLRKQVRAELKEIQRRSGITFLFVTHDQEEALAMSGQIAILNQGALEQEGTPEDLYRHPKTRFVASFLGAMNWIGGAGVRPECVRIARQKPAGDIARAAVAGAVTFLGAFVHVEARLESGEMATAQIAPEYAAFQPGDPVYLWWDPAAELRFDS